MLIGNGEGSPVYKQDKRPLKYGGGLNNTLGIRWESTSSILTLVNILENSSCISMKLLSTNSPSEVDWGVGGNTQLPNLIVPSQIQKKAN
jgi:hypothetical protein